MKKYILAFAIALWLALIVWIPNGLFAMPGTKEMYRILSDGLFLSGGVLAGFGVLGLIAGKSQHMGLKYLAYWLSNAFSRKEGKEPPMRYGEFHARHVNTGSSTHFLLIPGLICLALAVLFMVLHNQQAAPPAKVGELPAQTTTINQTEDTMKQNPTFTITLENGQVMTGELYPETAPQSVGNFISLANQSFYDGLTFHRVIPGFMIQGGCPSGTGMGGPGYGIKGEFSQNGVNNPIKHTRGVLSMARSMRMDSAGSQFFIMVENAPHLDGAYAAFGKILTGMEAADQIVSTKRDRSDKPLEAQVIKSIRVETHGVEYPFNRL